jgi:predicted ABC-type ATPase
VSGPTSRTASRPTCSLLAGPNGAGKSTLFSLIELPGTFINADEIAARIDPDHPANAALQAGREALRLLDAAFLEQDSFVYETTLSSHQSINVLRRARMSGFYTQVVFVALQLADLHVQRVRDRVMKGGHHIPEAVIRRRYDVAFDNLTIAVPLCDELAVFDNSHAAGPSLRLTIDQGTIASNALTRALPFDQKIAACVAPALHMRAEDLFVA